MTSRNYLIYGATGGIGANIVRRLVAQGHNVHLTASNRDKLQSLGNETGATWSVMDVLNDNAFDQLSRECPDKLDGLVYAIGNINLKPLNRFSPDDFRHDFFLNAAGAACAVQAALPALKAAEAPAIVLFSSIAAKQGFSLHASMGMAKGAVSGLTVSLAAELAPHIRVNAIAPSLTTTPLAEALITSPPIANALARQHPLQRLGQPDDIASLALWLLDPANSWMTGQIIGLDGGRSTLSTKH